MLASGYRDDGSTKQAVFMSWVAAGGRRSASIKWVEENLYTNSTEAENVFVYTAVAAVDKETVYAIGQWRQPGGTVCPTVRKLKYTYDAANSIDR
jgi:hypothetical protein